MPEILTEHYNYLSDRVRLERYQAAVEKIVRPEHSVLDLGCGAGVLGLMALRAGARKAIFVDHTPVIEIARQVIAEAGFANNADFFQTNSFELDLQERVDIVICDHVGCFGIDYGILGVLADAYERFLKPGGRLVPSGLNLKLAPVESKSWQDYVGRWCNPNVSGDFHWVQKLAANSKHLVDFKRGDLLADAATLASLEPGMDSNTFHSWSAEFTAARNGTLHGLGGWFDCELANGVRMTNSPLSEQHVDRPQALLPLEAPVPVEKGERINATVMVRHLDHIIAWTVEMPDSGRRISHSTFNSLLLDREAITRTQPNRPATLNDRGRARQTIASYCDGSRSVAEVEALVRTEHPDLLPSERAIETMVRKVLAMDTGD